MVNSVTAPGSLESLHVEDDQNRVTQDLIGIADQALPVIKMVEKKQINIQK